MKCPNCGAETKSGFCEYCGSELPKETPKVNVTNNYYTSADAPETSSVCPKCGGSKIKFSREVVGASGFGSARGSKNTRAGASRGTIQHQTVAVCQDCGYSWYPYPVKAKHGAAWWFFVILFFPISLSFWFYKTDKIKLKKSIRIAILIVAWAIFLLFSSGEDAADTQITASVHPYITQAETTQAEIYAEDGL